MSGNNSGKISYGMVIDVDKCTGCMTCAVACQQENNVPFREDETNKVRSITWLEVFYLDNGKPYPDHRKAYLPRPCLQCDAQTLSPVRRGPLPTVHLCLPGKCHPA